jgi:hypothetical protein
MSEAKALHSHRMGAEVSSSAPHLLHKALSDSPNFRGMSITFRVLTHLPHMNIVAFYPIRAYAILYLEQRCEINQ